MVKELFILQSFPDYLNITEFWAYRLLKYIPSNVQNIILSRNYLKNNFYIKDFYYIEFPLKGIDFSGEKFSVKLYNYTVHTVRRMLLHKYVKFFLNAKGINIHLVHSHFGNVGWCDIKLARYLNVPHIVSFYGVDYEKYTRNSKRWKRKYTELFRKADLFICEGNNGKRILTNLGCSEEKIIINRLGVDVKKIPFVERKKEKNKLKLLQIASFREKKGHIYTIQAFKKALYRCPNMTLTLVGEGEKKTEIISLIEKLGLTEKVKVLPYITGDRLHSFMKDYDVFIHPSCYASDGDCEGGAPVVLLDAQATGMPVISTTHCDIPEEVIHEKTGFLSPEKDIDSIAKFIEYFYKMEQETYNKFSYEARKHVEKFYDIEVNSKKLYFIYMDLLNGKIRKS